MGPRLKTRGGPKGGTLKALFLEHLRKTGNVSEAARAAGIDRKTAYNWRRQDEAFGDHWREALEEATDLLEAEARRRAIDGYDEPMLHAGRLICDPEGRPVMRKRYSDGLLRMLLRAHRPTRFREARIVGEDSLPILTKDDEHL
ncbi:hypothetical protein [Swaminathania salitolerans]|uniref:Insertion element IS150 protein InsJ-like helix-turn-helix domain-containing protein n=1 Tax=Swaminathania salitolerans TaxID=182838 RepID=A0A511BKI9_9PROT|nr:hypothetical protein [Swaminathania salitolerans]GBQ09762.1 hypothetical protein AA21291_0186 [Swaminathania salitolerans LMG 21291]GEL00857.1 hypothetical protein SSA02_00200 [Swaminathania salitolerans]